MIHRSWSNSLELLVPEPIQVFVSDFGNVAVSFVAQKSNEFAAAFVIDCVAERLKRSLVTFCLRRW
jgi:hypothetical protein